MFTVFLFNARVLQFFSTSARQALGPAAFQEVFLSKALNLGFHHAQLKREVQMSDIKPD